MADIVQAEVTCVKKFPPRGNFFRFSCPELKSDDNQYGNISAPATLYSKIQEKNVYRIAYHKEGQYLNLDTLITDVAKEPPPRPPTNPKDSDRMGRQGMVNGILSAITDAATLDLWVNTVRPEHIANIGLKCYAALQIMEQKIKEGYTGINPADVSTGKRKQYSKDMNDEIPFFPEEK